MSNKQNDTYYEAKEEMQEYVTVRLTKDQHTALLLALDDHINVGIWYEAEANDKVPAPEYMAFLRRIRRTLARS